MKMDPKFAYFQIDIYFWCTKKMFCFISFASSYLFSSGCGSRLFEVYLLPACSKIQIRMFTKISCYIADLSGPLAQFRAVFVSYSSLYSTSVKIIFGLYFINSSL